MPTSMSSARPRSYVVALSCSVAVTNPTDSAQPTDAYLTKLLSTARSAEQDLLRCQTVLSKPVIRAKTGIFSSKVVSLTLPVQGLQTDTYQLRNARVQSKDPLSRLPNELQCQIWSHLRTHADRTTFALTCKYHATMFKSEKAQEKRLMELARSTGSRSQEQSNKVVKARRLGATKHDKLMLLQRLQRWGGMSEWRLCYGCVRFLPVNYLVDNQGWSGRRILKHSIGVTAAVAEGQRCGGCVQRARVQILAYAPQFSDVTEIVKRTVGLRH